MCVNKVYIHIYVYTISKELYKRENKRTSQEIENLNNPISIEETEFLYRNFQIKKLQVPKVLLLNSIILNKGGINNTSLIQTLFTNAKIEEDVILSGKLLIFKNYKDIIRKEFRGQFT